MEQAKNDRPDPPNDADARAGYLPLFARGASTVIGGDSRSWILIHKSRFLVDLLEDA